MPADVAGAAFAELVKTESAVVMQPADLADIHNSRAPHDQIELFALAHVPSKHQLRGIMSSVNSGRAPGPDGLILDLVTIDPMVSADILYPFAMKLATAREEPNVAKGAIESDLHDAAGTSVEATQHILKEPGASDKWGMGSERNRSC